MIHPKWSGYAYLKCKGRYGMKWDDTTVIRTEDALCGNAVIFFGVGWGVFGREG